MDNSRRLVIDTNFGPIIATTKGDVTHSPQILSRKFSKVLDTHTGLPIVMPLNEPHISEEAEAASPAISATPTSERSPTGSPLQKFQRPALLRQWSSPVDNKEKLMANFLHREKATSFWVEDFGGFSKSPREAQPNGS